MANMQTLAFACLVLSAIAHNSSNIGLIESEVDTDMAAMTSMEAISDMAAGFMRSEQSHVSAMDALMQTMSSEQALAVLKAHPKSSELVEMAEAALHSKGALRSSKRSKALQPGYSGVDKA